MTTWPGTSIPKSTGNAFDLRAGMPQPVETRLQQGIEGKQLIDPLWQSLVWQRIQRKGQRRCMARGNHALVGGLMQTNTHKRRVKWQGRV